MPKYGSNCGCPHWMGHHLRESGDVAHRVGPVEPTRFISMFKVARPEPFHFCSTGRRESGVEKSTEQVNCIKTLFPGIVRNTVCRKVITYRAARWKYYEPRSQSH
jgi:hypothetical protein